VEDRVCPRGEAGERGFVVKAAGNPGNAVARRLIAAGERADLMAAGARVAFGAATSSERFTARELRDLVVGMTAGGRASLDWRIEEQEFSKPQARALTNLAYLTVGALPLGGNAVIQSRVAQGALFLEGFAEGARARLKPEAVVGLTGRRLTEGLAGQWIQPYWLWLTVKEAGGTLRVAVQEERIALVARMPH
jgi:histidine phosphotransferase ChpT